MMDSMTDSAERRLTDIMISSSAQTSRDIRDLRKEVKATDEKVNDIALDVSTITGKVENLATTRDYDELKDKVRTVQSLGKDGIMEALGKQSKDCKEKRKEINKKIEQVDEKVDKKQENSGISKRVLVGILTLMAALAGAVVAVANALN